MQRCSGKEKERGYGQFAFEKCIPCSRGVLGIRGWDRTGTFSVLQTVPGGINRTGGK